MSNRDAARALAALMAGTWRAAPESVPIPDLSPLMAVIHRSGAGPLVWRRVAGTPSADLPEGQLLRRDYLAQAAAGVAREADVVRAVTGLRAAGVEPLVSKGWAVARHYPEPGLRPSADVDLFVDPDDFERAEAALAHPDLADLRTDLHAGLPDLPDRGWAELAARAEEVPLGGTTIRVPAPDDLLRHVCLHLLRHAAWRPLWFCDVGVLVESTRLDWDRLRTGSPRQTAWTLQVVGLAGALVGARTAGVPWAPAPAWLEESVLDHWMAGDVHLYDGIPLAHHLGHPRAFWRALVRRWPSPLQASVDRGAAFDDAPRFPLQLADVASRAVRSLVRLPGVLYSSERKS